MDAIDEFLLSAASSKEDLALMANQHFGTVVVFGLSSLFWCALICRTVLQNGGPPNFLEIDIRSIGVVHSAAFLLFKLIASLGAREAGDIGLVKWTSLEGDPFLRFWSFIAVVLLVDWLSGGTRAARVHVWLIWYNEVVLRAHLFILLKARDSLVWLGSAISQTIERLLGPDEGTILNKVWRMLLRLGDAIWQTVYRFLELKEVWEDGVDEQEQDE